MVKITFVDGTEVIWDYEEYSDYEYIEGLFVFKNSAGGWIGIYNMSVIRDIVVSEPQKTKRR